MITQLQSEQYKVVLSVAALVWLALRLGLSQVGDRWPETRQRFCRRGLTVALAAMTVLSVANYYRFDTSRAVTKVTGYDTFHYYLNAKYFPELGYHTLYECAFVADRSLGGKTWLQSIRHIRRLTDYKVVSTRRLKKSKRRKRRCRERFSAARWSAFKKDLRQMRPFVAWKQRRKMMIDRGYNATPTWNMVGGGLANVTEAADLPTLANVDLALMAAAFAAVGWAFGLEACLLLMLFFFTSWFTKWPLLGSALLRYDWVAAIIVAMSLLKKGFHGAAGAAVMWAVSVRLFPAVLPFALGLKALSSIHWRRGDGPTGLKRLPRKYRRFGAGALLAGLAIGLLTLSNAGPAAFSESAKNLSVHSRAENISAQRIGLGIAMAYRAEPKLTQATRARVARVKPFKYVGLVLVLGLLALAVRRVSDTQAMALGVALLFAATHASYYYYIVLVAMVLYHLAGPRSRDDMVGLGVLFALAVVTYTLEHAERNRYFTMVMTTFSIGVYLLSVLLKSAVPEGVHLWRSWRAGAAMVAAAGPSVQVAVSQTEEAPQDDAKSARPEPLFAGQPWPWSARLAVIAGGLAGLEALVAGEGRAALAAAALGVTVGALLGGVFDLIEWAVARSRWRWALMAWPLFFAAAGGWLARALGVVERLGGANAALAWTALVGLCVGVALGGLVLAALQRRPGRQPWLLDRSERAQRVALGLVYAMAALCALVDRAYLVGLYPVAHIALRFATLICLGAAAYQLRTWQRGYLKRLTMALVALVVLTFTALHRAPRTLATVADRPFGAGWLDSLRAVTDFDADGVSGLLAGGDVAPWDGDITLMAASAQAPDPTLVDTKTYSAPEPSPVSVVFISVDTLRPDRLGAYGHRRDTSPHIDELAAISTRFTAAYTAGTWTSLAMSAAHRGVYPRRLNWTRLVETNRYRLLRANELGSLQGDETPRLYFGLPVDDPRPTLAERLKARGMATLAVVDDGYSQFFDPQFGAAAGFDSFEVVPALKGKAPNSAVTREMAISALKNAPTDRPFFLWVHFFGAHGPTRKMEGIPWYGKSPYQKYDHMVRYTDTQLGPFLEALKAVREQRPLLTILTSDHGESLTGSRRYHGTGVTEGQVRIPLLISGPGFEAGVDKRLSSLVDVAPTVLAATQTPVGGAVFDGLDLAQAIPEDRAVIAETWRYRADGAPAFDMMTVLGGEAALTLDRRRNTMRTTHRGKQGLKRGDEVPTPEHLKSALNDYLSQTRGGQVSWSE